jgi:predicted NUDIX family phosphoesterase
MSGWQRNYPDFMEYVMVEKVLVVPAGQVQYKFQAGFFHLEDEKPLEALLRQARFIDRPLAEDDPTLKQIIPYSLLCSGERIFRYQRTRAGSEKRLHGLYSVGVGGHINPVDADQTGMDIVRAAALREIAEEFVCRPSLPAGLPGLINDDSNPVGRVHLGVVFRYELLDESISPNEPENFADFGLASATELSSTLDQYETWSQIAIRALS